MALALIDAFGRLTKEALFCGFVHINKTLFTRYYWTDELPRGALPTVNQIAKWQDRNKKRCSVTGRKVLKTTFLEAQFLWYALNNPRGTRNDGLFTTPGDAQMAPTLNRLEYKIFGTPLFHLLIDKYNKNQGELQFKTGFWWYARIEGVDGSGRNMVGLKCMVILGDEQAFGAQKAHDARLQVALDPVNVEWDYNGVPNGVRSTPFYRIDQDPLYGKGWSMHRMDTFENPANRSEKARAELAAQYGGENAQEYLNNVLGLWGDERASSFPMAHLEAARSLDQPFVAIEISDTQALTLQAQIGSDAFPWYQLLSRVESAATAVAQRGAASIIGIDHGYSPDPSSVLVFYLDSQATDASGQEVWRELCSIQLFRIIAREHADFIHTLREILNKSLAGPCLGICADQAGYGGGTYTDFLFVDPRFPTDWYLAHTVSVAFGSTEADLDPITTQPKQDRDGRVIRRRRKQTSTEIIKEALAENLRDEAFSTHYLA